MDSRSRRKLAPEAFLELNDIIWKDFYKEVDYYGYYGHKPLAVDGTYLNLPNHPGISEEFDRRGMGTAHWLPVREFRASRNRDTIVTLTVPDKYYDSFAGQFPSMKREVKCRLVKIALENGEEEILGTSLLAADV